jgi:hypothetical protein
VESQCAFCEAGTEFLNHNYGVVKAGHCFLVGMFVIWEGNIMKTSVMMALPDGRSEWHWYC